jgi:hypothetical protein
MKPEKTLNIAVLVVSCDNYADLWRPFFKLFKRFWADCPFPVYLLSNELKGDFTDINNITVGKDISWSDSLKTGLLQINAEYVLMVIDDLFFTGPVNTERLMVVCDEFIKVQGNYLRLNPTVKADMPYNEHFGLVSKGSYYRTSTVFSLWKKNILMDLLKSGESPWEFEVFGTVRSDAYGDFYSTLTHFFPNVNGVIKGKWQRSAIKRLQKLGIKLELDTRKTMKLRETMRFYFILMRFKALQLFPPGYRRYIKDLLSGGQCRYSLKK